MGKYLTDFEKYGAINICTRSLGVGNNSNERDYSLDTESQNNTVEFCMAIIKRSYIYIGFSPKC